MRVLCTSCGETAIIGKTNRLSLAHADLYCSCSNPECGHTFVANLSFSHTLSPSAQAASAIVSELARALSPTQRQQLQQELNLL
ncbi:transcriptional activator Ogr/delta [Shewanella halifaxensis HAW-EB4]|uniref:Transcriptional activator Ogr/delta n=1 Tax=Shewanella halifaxensis (strain HAW-EB4) TaxID=458817 RepID=B0TKT2_SHEHH|nr:ogr/Delta-like zinc finger family protein [Shewanella halifaxensis]ABZ75884.1 transcriptional activator Ogr/delta [Shewanella halifaxensis HAW-EB4]